MKKPPLPILLSDFFLASFNYLSKILYSSSVRVLAPSSATELADPGSSISRSTSCVLAPFTFMIWSPSSLTFVSCLFFSAFEEKTYSFSVDSAKDCASAFFLVGILIGWSGFFSAAAGTLVAAFLSFFAYLSDFFFKDFSAYLTSSALAF
jgi:hypothetical protein